MFKKLRDVYDKKGSTNDQKWNEWWKLFSPDEHEIPDGRHYDTISISTANIPKVLQAFPNMWNKESEGGMLPTLDNVQMERAIGLLDALIRALPIIEKQRAQRTRPQTTQDLGSGPGMSVSEPQTPHHPLHTQTAQDLSSGPGMSASEYQTPHHPLHTQTAQDLSSGPGMSTSEYQTSQRPIHAQTAQDLSSGPGMSASEYQTPQRPIHAQTVQDLSSGPGMSASESQTPQRPIQTQTVQDLSSGTLLLDEPFELQFDTTVDPKDLMFLR